MKDLLILYPHGLGDCILLTPALREFFKATGNKVHIATLERFKSAEFFDNNPYVDKIFYTKDAWNDYQSSQIGFSSLYKQWKEFAKERSFGGIVMPMHSEPISKIDLNFRYLGITSPENERAELYTTEKDVEVAKEIISNLTNSRPFGFIQTNTGVKQKDLPVGYGEEWLSENRGLDTFIEVGKHFSSLDYNINVQFEIMRRAEAVCLPDSVFYHACHAIGKTVDLAYFGRGQGVYERVRHTISSEEKVVYKL